MTHSKTPPNRLLRSRWGLPLAFALLATAALMTLALIPADAGQLEAAIATQRARVALDGNATDLNDLANLLVVRGNLVEAEEIYRKALELAPESVEVPYNLALLLQHLERETEALKLFQQVVRKVPDAAWAHLQIGVISADKGKRKRSVAAFVKAFSLEPRLASAAINPHLQRLPEVLEAMLQVSSDARAPQTAPLSFSEPDRIAQLLIGESAAARAAARSVERRGLIEKEPNATSDGQEDRLSVESLPNRSLAEARPSPKREPAPNSLNNTEAGSEAADHASQDYKEPSDLRRASESSNTTAEPAAQRRVVGEKDLRAVHGAGVTGAASQGGGAKARGASAAPRKSPRRQQPPGLTRGSKSRFQPGTRSSARLDLHTLPAQGHSGSRWAFMGAPGR